MHPSCRFLVFLLKVKKLSKKPHIKSRIQNSGKHAHSKHITFFTNLKVNQIFRLLAIFHNFVNKVSDMA